MVAFDEKNLGNYHTEIYLINFRISYSNEAAPCHWTVETVGIVSTLGKVA